MKSRFALLALSLIFALAFYAPAFAAENNDDKDAPAAAAVAEEASTAEEAIPAVPENGTLKDYQEYVSNLKGMLDQRIKSAIAQAQKDGVNPRSEEFSNSLKEMAKQFFALIEKATDKALLIKDISEEELRELVVDKIQLIQTLAQINGEDEDAANAKMEALVQQLRNMDKTELADVIESNIFKKKIVGYAQSGNVEAFAKVAAEIDQQVEKAGKDITPDLARKAALIVLASANLPDYKAPEGLQEKYIKAFSEASNPEVQKLAGALERAMIRSEGEKRFRESLGKEFKFGGTFIDGSEYKAEDYAGKVVLIDFWATWCGPCRAELPNVKKMYAAYHDKGFEVIGVSCDDPEKEESLNKFLKDNDIAWKQMFDEKAIIPEMIAKDGKPILVSEYYGINGIPCPVLIGKDGKVLSLNARGEELEEQLVKIYGKVEAKADEEADDAETTEADVEDIDAEDNTEAADALPDVPENGTLADYKEYIKKVNDLLNKNAQRLIIQAQRKGIDPQSEEFLDSLKSMANKYVDVMLKATDKALLFKDAPDEEFEELVGGKIQLLQLTSQLNDEGEDAFNAKLHEFAEQLRKMDKAKFADDIETKLFGDKILGYVMKGDVKEFAKVAAEIDEKVEKAGKDITVTLAQQAILICMAGTELEGYEAPEGRIDTYLKALKEASDPEVNKLAADLEELISRAEAEKRFKEALGNEFKFGGTFTDGSEYKAEDYAGKVVLIDFWATWCGPCRAELPNVKKMYAAYHDKGFEVIGVSCDDPDEEENLNKFLKDNDITWKQMFDDKAVVPGEKNKDGKPVLVSEYYGINGIPCPVLIGADGKVLSLNARGEELKEQLVKIYGKVEGLDDEEDADAEDEDEFIDDEDLDAEDAEEAQPEEPAAEEDEDVQPEEPAAEDAAAPAADDAE